jgi:transposase-like protein
MRFSERHASIIFHPASTQVNRLQLPRAHPMSISPTARPTRVARLTHLTFKSTREPQELSCAQPRADQSRNAPSAVHAERPCPRVLLSLTHQPHGELRSSKYLNNLIKQDHRSVKQRVAVMLGFKQFCNATITIAGFELMHRIRKGQFGLRRLSVQGGAAPGV